MNLLKDLYWEFSVGWAWRFERWSSGLLTRVNLTNPVSKLKNVEVSGDELAKYRHRVTEEYNG